MRPKDVQRVSIALLLMLRLATAQYFDGESLIVPPLGNSPSRLLKTQAGMQQYRCLEGRWSLTGSSAKLLDEGTRAEAGNVTSISHVNGDEYYTLAMFNDVGDWSESGYSSSLVLVEPVAWDYENNSTRTLMEATSHQFAGAAADVSYVQRYNTSGELPASEAECTLEDSVMDVPYSAMYSVWTQDAWPVPVPQSLAVGNNRFVTEFFAKGYISYEYRGSGYEEVSRCAMLYNVPGSDKVGEYRSYEGQETWKILDPNGWTIFGRSATEPVVVEDNCIPWTLSTVTGEEGVPAMLGPFTYIQMTSTRGGEVPTVPPTSTGANTTQVFSAIFWLFTSQ